MNIFGKLTTRQEELYVKALCYDMNLEYTIHYDKNKLKWFALRDLTENQYLLVLRKAEDYFLQFERESPFEKNTMKISA